MPYSDVESILIPWLVAVVAPLDPSAPGWDRVYPGGVDDLPAEIALAVPVVTVNRFGGNDQVPGLDRANVDVDTYASTRDHAKAIAEAIRAAIRTSLAGYTADGAVVTRAQTIAAPAAAPYVNGYVRRYTAAYRITVHTTRAL